MEDNREYCILETEWFPGHPILESVTELLKIGTKLKKLKQETMKTQIMHGVKTVMMEKMKKIYKELEEH